MEQVILVDDQDHILGRMEKLEAHRLGRLHRAISVFIFNGKGELLLQQRAAGKYHSAGLWTNTCCSHPRPDESNMDAARRRLQEEMGIDCPLTHWFSFTYRAEFNNGLIEHEYDHVFFGVCNQEPNPDPEEVAAFRYISRQDLALELKEHPELFTVWFNICLERISEIFADTRLI